MVKETETLKLVAENRSETGSHHARRLRHEGWLPCVMYGVNAKPTAVKVNRHDIEMIVKHHGGQNVIVDLIIDGQTTKNVLIKDLQRDRITDRAVHADFLKITMTRKLRVMVAIRLKGEPVGVTQHGGILEHQTRSVEVECLPTDIVKEFTLDTSALDIDNRLFARDIKTDPKLTILTPGDTVIASVHMPKIEEEETKPEEEEAVEGAETAEAGEEAEAAGEKKEGAARQPETAEKPEGDKGQEKSKDKEKGKGKVKSKDQG